MTGPTSDAAELYDRIAAAYQRWWAPVIEPAAVHLLDLIEGTVAARPAAVVLDVGAGTGTLSRAAVTRWPAVHAVAVDPSAGMLEVGRGQASTALAPADRRRIRWVIGPAEHLPVADHSVDAVVSSFTLQYLPDRAAGLREAYRVLRPGGVIAVVTWLVDDWPFEPWRLFSELLGMLHIERPPSLETGLFRSLPSAAALLRRAGFRDVHAMQGVVEWQWTLDAYVHFVMESEERDLVDSLDVDTRGRLERLWRDRLGRLSEADLLYRGLIAYVSGRKAIVK